jgi:hypothetical protein
LIQDAASSSSTVLHSFSYLGDLGVEGYGSGTTTAVPQPQQWQDSQQQDTLQFYEDVSLPAPPLIANPYDGATGSAWIPEEVETETTSTSIAPIVSKPSISAITQVRPQTATKQNNVRSIWETSAPTVVQGTSLRTWNFNSARLQAAQVLLKTNGRPLHAEIELWQGESHTPQKIAVYTENGEERPFSAFLATPFQGPSAIAVKNSANAEFPLQACVEGDLFDTSLNNQNKNANSSMSNAGYGSKLAQATLRRLYESANPRTVQGDGAAYVIPLEESVARVQVLITTEERPLNARIELLQGPNNVKQVIEVSTEDGKARPFFAVLETPGLANAMRIVNTGPVEFPIECRVEPFSVVDGMEDSNYFFDTVDANGQQSPAKNWNVFNFLSGGK